MKSSIPYDMPTNVCLRYRIISLRTLYQFLSCLVLFPLILLKAGSCFIHKDIVGIKEQNIRVKFYFHIINVRCIVTIRYGIHITLYVNHHDKGYGYGYGYGYNNDYRPSFLAYIQIYIHDYCVIVYREANDLRLFIIYYCVRDTAQ